MQGALEVVPAFFIQFLLAKEEPAPLGFAQVAVEGADHICAKNEKVMRKQQPCRVGVKSPEDDVVDRDQGQVDGERMNETGADEGIGKKDRQYQCGVVVDGDALGADPQQGDYPSGSIGANQCE